MSYMYKTKPKQKSETRLYPRMAAPIALRVLASSVKIADRAGQIVRDIMSAGELGQL